MNSQGKVMLYIPKDLREEWKTFSGNIDGNIVVHILNNQKDDHKIETLNTQNREQIGIIDNLSNEVKKWMQIIKDLIMENDVSEEEIKKCLR